MQNDIDKFAWTFRPETLAVHAGRGIDPVTGALSTPLHLSTTFERDADGGFSRGFAYTREGNPTRGAFENALQALEGRATSIAFASGMAAIAALFQAHGLGARLVVPDDMYFGNRQLLFETPLGRSFEVSVVDMTDLAAVERACAGKPALVWVDHPEIAAAERGSAVIARIQRNPISPTPLTTVPSF
jgi:cystathionine gamma-synthase